MGQDIKISHSGMLTGKLSRLAMDSKGPTMMREGLVLSGNAKGNGIYIRIALNSGPLIE